MAVVGLVVLFGIADSNAEILEAIVSEQVEVDHEGAMDKPKLADGSAGRG